MENSLDHLVFALLQVHGVQFFESTCIVSHDGTSNVRLVTKSKNKTKNAADLDFLVHNLEQCMPVSSLLFGCFYTFIIIILVVLCNRWYREIMFFLQLSSKYTCCWWSLVQSWRRWRWNKWQGKGCLFANGKVKRKGKTTIREYSKMNYITAKRYIYTVFYDYQCYTMPSFFVESLR